MHDYAGHLAIVAGAGLAACALSLAIGFDRQSKTTPSDETAVVVALPQRPSAAVIKASAPQQPPVAASRDNKGSLAQQLQSELKRVGCYDGEINGVWTTSTRFAMQTFTERVNAKLPIDKPDPILLALVQGHQERVCAASCSAGQAPRSDGRCMPEAVLAKASDKPETAEIGSAKTTSSPGAGAPAAAIAPRLVSPPTEVTRAAEPAKLDPKPTAPNTVVQPPPGPAPVPGPHAPAERQRTTAAHQGGPIPSVGVYERRLKRFSRSVQSQQMAYARSLFRNLQRAVKTSLPLP
jgi:hypothetical protein